MRSRPGARLPSPGAPVSDLLSGSDGCGDIGRGGRERSCDRLLLACQFTRLALAKLRLKTSSAVIQYKHKDRRVRRL
jgi:hypothetical protein